MSLIAQRAVMYFVAERETCFSISKIVVTGKQVKKRLTAPTKFRWYRIRHELNTLFNQSFLFMTTTHSPTFLTIRPASVEHAPCIVGQI